MGRIMDDRKRGLRLDDDTIDSVYNRIIHSHMLDFFRVPLRLFVMSRGSILKDESGQDVDEYASVLPRNVLESNSCRSGTAFILFLLTGNSGREVTLAAGAVLLLFYFLNRN
ncbi:hypothetical protein M9H77_00401 [Catharanthus roseus]|nr:hypothetical protein M9H77_00401 [Catharanthus roseus]